MNADRFEAITAKYSQLRVAVVGDFCLDRYLEIDPARTETSIETDLPVYNVANVRAQPDVAGTEFQFFAALGIGTLYPVGFAGEDGEGYELCRALAATWACARSGIVRCRGRRARGKTTERSRDRP